MIKYDKLWETMKAKQISTYRLREDYGFHTKTISKLRKNENVNISTINKLCSILDCDICDIVEFIKD